MLCDNLLWYHWKIISNIEHKLLQSWKLTHHVPLYMLSVSHIQAQENNFDFRPTEQRMEQFVPFHSPAHPPQEKNPVSLSAKQGNGIFCTILCTEAKVLQWSPFRSKKKVLFHSKDAGHFQKGKKQDKSFFIMDSQKSLFKNYICFYRNFGHHWYKWHRTKLKIDLVLYRTLTSSSLSHTSCITLGKAKLKEWCCNWVAWNFVWYAV